MQLRRLRPGNMKLAKTADYTAGLSNKLKTELGVSLPVQFFYESDKSKCCDRKLSHSNPFPQYNFHPYAIRETLRK